LSIDDSDNGRRVGKALSRKTLNLGGDCGAGESEEERGGLDHRLST
jgi:hypothetical protein